MSDNSRSIKLAEVFPLWASFKKVESVQNGPTFFVAGSRDRQGNVVEGVVPNITSESPEKRVNFSASETWFLTTSSVVDTKGSPNSIKLEQEGFTTEFPIGKTRLQYDNEGSFNLETDKGRFLSGNEVRQNSKMIWTIQDPNCESCNKQLVLDILEKTDNKLTIKMNSEDEGSTVSYIFSFTKNNYGGQ